MKPMELTKSMKSNKLANRVKGWSAIICLALAIFSTACHEGNETPPPCSFCGFNGNEQIQDLGTGGGLYGANGSGCVVIENPSGRSCGRFFLQPLTGNQS